MLKCSLDSLQDDEKLVIDDPTVTPTKKSKTKKTENEALMAGFNEFYGLVPPPYLSNNIDDIIQLVRT